jgi:hypothetical protein
MHWVESWFVHHLALDQRTLPTRLYGCSMTGRPSCDSLCPAYGGTVSTRSNSYVLQRFPRREERAHVGCRSVERIRAFLSDGRLCTPDASAVRQRLAPPGRSLGAYMEFLYGSRFSAVEFLWRPGPLSRRYERVPSCFPERDRRRTSPRQRSSAVIPGRLPHDVRVSAARRGAGRGRPDPGRASGRGSCGHSDSPGFRNRLNAAVHLGNRPLQNGSAPTMSTCEFLVLRFFDDLNFVKGSA